MIQIPAQMKILATIERTGDDGTHGWLDAQLAGKKTEPNSGLGKAITYLLRHWRP